MNIPNIWENKTCSKPPTKYPLVINSSLLQIAENDSWFTSEKDGDFPVRYVSLPEGNTM